jgi:hypothetical protein
MSETTMYLVFSNPVDESTEQDFNDWYDTVHLPEVLATPGMVSAQRYKVRETQIGRQTGMPPQKYLIVYEMDDDPDTVMQRIFEAHASGALHMHDALDMDSVTTSYWSAQGPKQMS